LKWSNDTGARFYKKYYRLLECGDFEINRRPDLETRKSLVLHLQLKSFFGHKIEDWQPQKWRNKHKKHPYGNFYQ
jgi:hypothetical protein